MPMVKITKVILEKSKLPSEKTIFSLKSFARTYQTKYSKCVGDNICWVDN